MGPYNRSSAGPASSITWFNVEHPQGALPAEGQRPDAVGCVAKALQALRLADGSGAAAQEIAAMPAAALLELGRRYAGTRDAGA